MMKNEDEIIESQMAAEELNGGPFPCTAEQGVADMQSRIKYLRKCLEKIHPDARDSDAELRLIREIRDAEVRLKAYQLQLDGRN